MLVKEAWMNPTCYNDAARIESIGSHEYRASIHPDYSYGTTAHGGFIQSLLLETVNLHFATTLASYQQPDTLSFHTEFIRPSAVGEARIAIVDTRLSKTSSTVHVSLAQQGKDCVVGYFTSVDALCHPLILLSKCLLTIQKYQPSQSSRHLNPGISPTTTSFTTG